MIIYIYIDNYVDILDGRIYDNPTIIQKSIASAHPRKSRQPLPWLHTHLRHSGHTGHLESIDHQMTIEITLM
jgi:GH25 family lysozyme M1 (1,4-beta-N-acetylmuramidase)